MCKGSQSTTSNTSYSPNPQALGAYSQLLSEAQGVAATPYNPYTGELVAPVNAQENMGIGGVNQYAGFSLPYIQSALGAAQSATTPITASQIEQYESPYTQQVVNATQAEFNNQNAQQAQQLNSNAIAQGAMGGNRVGVAQAELANQQQMAQAPTIANLENQGYQTGLNTALTEQQAQLMGAYGLAGIGTSGQASLLSGAGQQIGAGQLQQSTQQAQDTAAYQQYLNQMAYPFQTLQWLGGLEGSIGSQMGGSGAAQTTGPAPSWLSQLGGLGSLATGLGGSSGLLSSLMFLSDRRVKENIKSIGRLNDGQIIYKFNYKGDPTTHIGLMAQEVEKEHPNAVHKDDSGIRYVDYDKATEDSEGVAKRQMGGGMEGPMMMPQQGVAGGGLQNASPAPYSVSNSSYVPAGQLSPAYPFSWRLPQAPPAPNTNPNPAVTGQGVAQLAKGIFGQMNSPTNTTPANQTPATPVGAVSPMGTAPAVNNPTMTVGPQFDSDTAVYRRGGGIRYRDDGGGLDSDQPLSLAAPSPGPSDSPPPPSNGVAGPPLAFAGTPDLSSSDVASFQRNPSAWANSISGIEQDSRGYGSIGPTTQSGDRAYGKYQVMGANIPQWTQQYAGRSMTPQEFLADPQAQEAVFNGKFGEYVSAYGSEGAARAWYAGPKGMNNPNAVAHDANGNPMGLTVADYGQRFIRGLGAPSSGVAGPQQAAPDQPAQSGSQGVAGSPGFLQKLFPNVDFSPNSKLWPALIAAGAGMMSSRSPFPGVAIGEGATAGLNEYQAETAAQTAAQLKQSDLDINSKKLQLEIDKMQADYNYHTAELAQKNKSEEREASKPVEYAAGVDPWTGAQTKSYAVRNPQGIWTDTQTGKPVDSLNGGRAASPTVPSQSTVPSPPAAPSTTPSVAPPPTMNAPVNPAAPPSAGPTPPVTPAVAPGGAQPQAVPVNQSPGATPLPAAAPASAPPQVTMTPARGQLRPALSYNPTMLPTGVDPSTVDPKTGIGKDGRDYAYLQSISNPDAAGDVLSLVNYQIDPTSLGYRGINRGKIMAAASIFDPNFHQEWFKDISGTEGAFSHGALGNQVRFFQNAVEHQQTLLDYAKAMGNGDIQAMNRIKNAIGVQFGTTAPNTFEGLRQLVAGEVVKAATGAQGALGDRDEIAKSFNSSSSLPQLISLLQGFQDLGGAQLFHLETQFQSGTHDQRGDFATYMHLDKASTDQLRRQEARDAVARGGLSTFSTPADVQQAVADRRLRPGDRFLLPDGRVGRVPQQ